MCSVSLPESPNIPDFLPKFTQLRFFKFVMAPVHFPASLTQSVIETKDRVATQLG